MAVRAQSVLTASIVDYDEADDITQYFPYNRTDRPPHTCPAYMTGHIAAPASRENTDRSRPGPRSGRSSHRSRPCYTHCRRCRRDRAGGSALRSSRACRYTDRSRGDTCSVIWLYITGQGDTIVTRYWQVFGMSLILSLGLRLLSPTFSKL